MEQTVAIVKPDGVKRGLIGEIIRRFEQSGLKVVALKMVYPQDEILHKHYRSTDKEYLKSLGQKTTDTYKRYGMDIKKEFKTDDTLELGKLVMDWLLSYIKSGPVVAMVLEGRHAVDNARSIAGPTMPVLAPAGTIRGDFSTDSAAYANRERRGVMNLVHISGSIPEAETEKSLWFKSSEIHNYKRIEEYLTES